MIGSPNVDYFVKIPYFEKELFRIAPKNSVLICAEGGSAGRKMGRINQDICFVNKFDFLKKSLNRCSTTVALSSLNILFIVLKILLGLNKYEIE